MKDTPQTKRNKTLINKIRMIMEKGIINKVGLTASTVGGQVIIGDITEQILFRKGIIKDGRIGITDGSNKIGTTDRRIGGTGLAAGWV